MHVTLNPQGLTERTDLDIKAFVLIDELEQRGEYRDLSFNYTIKSFKESQMEIKFNFTQPTLVS